MNIRFDHGDTRFNAVRPYLWVGLVACLSIGGSLAFACAAPLAAVGALAGTTTDRKTGFALAILAWLSNQIVGYGLLHYPQTFDSFAWGAAIGIATIAAYLAASFASTVARPVVLSFSLAFLAAFAACELTLFIAGIPLGASEEAFSLPVIARIFEVNLVSFAGLLCLYILGTTFAVLPARAKEQVRSV